MTDRETRIRERAHQIWEEEGRPEGRERDHWERAAGEYTDEDSEQQSSVDGGSDNPEDTSGTSVGSDPGGSTGSRRKAHR